MEEDNKKTLPIDSDSDYSLPGRFEESNPKFFEPEPIPTKSSNKLIVIASISFLVFAAGIFSFYFLNQNEIDSKILQNNLVSDPEQDLVARFGVGEYGSDHEHAAIAVFVLDNQINFGLSQFQIASKYIHFENNNPYLIHRHATNVPLEMLFASMGMKISQDCINLNVKKSETQNNNQFCEGQGGTLSVYLNDEKYFSDISQYVINHNDRILISFGDEDSIPKQISYLQSLKIFDIPKKIPDFSGEDITF